jgi:sulfate/thiosulfate transport system permease protein
VSAYRKRRGVLPGFRLTLGLTLLYVCLLIMIPLAALVAKSSSLSLDKFWQVATTPRALASYRITLFCSFVAALINTIFGVLTAWVLTRYRIPGKRLIDALVDLPFALPTAVAGIALTAIYAQNGPIGRVLHAWGIDVAFTPLGIIVALTFIGLPFVVRTVQPVLQAMDPEIEEAAESLGASSAQFFLRIVVPTLAPATLTGFTLAFARALGEYGSVVFISGNLPLRTEITTLLIMTKLEQYDYAGATALGVVMLLLSFTLLLVINLLQAWGRRWEA